MFYTVHQGRARRQALCLHRMRGKRVCPAGAAYAVTRPGAASAATRPLRGLNCVCEHKLVSSLFATVLRVLRVRHR